MSYLTAAGRVVTIWGQALDTSPDAGIHWWQSFFSGGIRSANITGTKIRALVESDATSRRHPTTVHTRRYQSVNGGRTWQRLGNGPVVPVGPAGPGGAARRFCG